MYVQIEQGKDARFYLVWKDKYTDLVQARSGGFDKFEEADDEATQHENGFLAEKCL